jgi:NitT/TauT family transport system permease protein
MLTFSKSIDKRPISSRDFIALMLLAAIMSLLESKADDLYAPIYLINHNSISLKWTNLPHYALLTVVRMLIAAVFSIFFSVVIGWLAAKYEKLEKIIIPAIDILQSVPILAFLSFTISFFLSLFPGNRMGVECAAIFVIFTSQVWNITLSCYQSFKNIPENLNEVAKIMQLSPIDKFFRLEMPFAMPGMIWNMMLSMSTSWFFIVASEAITVGKISYTLPGMGSYISLAIKKMDINAVFLTIITMIIVIYVYNFLVFKPILTWSDKFRYENNNQSPPSSIIFNLFQKNFFLSIVKKLISKGFDKLLDLQYQNSKKTEYKKPNQNLIKLMNVIWHIAMFAIFIFAAVKTYFYMEHFLTLKEILYVFKLNFYTALRVAALVILSLMIWIPIGVFIGLRPSLTEHSQSIIQFLAAFPVNLVFPLIVILIKYFDLNPNIWLTFLMMIGTQWYIAFNVIAGVSIMRQDLKELCSNFKIKGFLWWFKVVIPSISPYIVTGVITASGASWNASIVSEIVNWGNDVFTAQGIGSYIALATQSGNFKKITLGVIILSIVVTLINRLVWDKLYKYTEQITKI